LAPLAKTKEVEFYSLQKGRPTGQSHNPPAGMQLHDFSGELADFADTAALISQLDLIISVDTAVAHLAAAMGKKVWTLLPFVPDWRWMMQGENTPWYSTMKLFRQPSRGDWAAVIDCVAEQLNAVPPP
jgi:ADP-heptose:LPS heptosyltransferase